MTMREAFERALAKRKPNSSETLGEKAESLGQDWYLFRSLPKSSGETAVALRGRWRTLRGMISLLDLRKRMAVLEDLAIGLHVRDNESEAFEGVGKIKRIIPTFLVNMTPGFIIYHRDITTGAVVYTAAILDLSDASNQTKIDDFQELGKLISRQAYYSSKARLKHVIPATAEWLGFTK